jgi:dipeptidyl aminopeptidase/acylaminoacyl peptidase
VKATDLPLMTAVSRPTLHPSGRRALVAVSHPDLDSNAYLGQLWTIPITGHAAPRRFTRGFRDSAPQYSPDGRLIAFIRASEEGPGQLYVVDSAGGEPVAVTDRGLGVSEFCWAPDGRSLAFVSREPERGRYGSDPEVDPASEPPRRITTLKYRQNGLGYSIDRPAQVFVVDVPDVWGEFARSNVPESRQVTDAAVDHSAIAFHPDGSKIAVVSTRHRSRDRDLRSNVFLIDPSGQPEAVDLTGSHGHFSVLDSPGSVAFGSEGELYFLAANVGRSGRDFIGKAAALFVTDAAGAEPRRLTDPETIDLTESTVTPLDGSVVLVQNRTRGTLQLLRVTADGAIESISDDAPIEITGVAAAGTAIVVSYADAGTTGDVAVFQNGAMRRVTDFSARLRNTGIVRPQELTVAGRNGYPIHGWVAVPEGEGPHPVLLNIHGGPFAQYSVHLFDEVQVFVDAGYAVVFCNPRGSAGYGQAHGRSIRKAMGTSDLADVLDFLDGAVTENDALDGERVGIMGGSYGGYLTAWTIAHDHRFAGAIVERGFLDPEVFVGTSDIGSFFADEYTGTDPEKIKAQSPQAMVDEVTTPTLVLHSEDDLRCPLSQAERYYTALKRRGVDTELVIFPGENHELSRSGKPLHRVQRFEIMLEWWARYLPTPENTAVQS